MCRELQTTHYHTPYLKPGVHTTGALEAELIHTWQVMLVFACAVYPVAGADATTQLTATLEYTMIMSSWPCCCVLVLVHLVLTLLVMQFAQ